MFFERLAQARPIRVRVAIMNLVMAGSALLLASAILTFSQYLSLRGSLLDDLRVQARIVGENSAAALVFKDPKAAQEILAALKASPSITLGQIHDEDHQLFAGYRRDGAVLAMLSLPDLGERDHRFSAGHLDVMQEIRYQGRSIGFLHIQSSLDQLYSRLLGYAGTTALVALGALAMAFLLVDRLRHAVTHAEERLDFLAHYDPVTHLPNRHAFNERLGFALSRVDQFGGAAALLFLDLDNFKIVNDTLGHHTGDLLLRAVAQRLSAGLRRGDTICRIGGDEFAVILENVSDAGEAEVVAQKTLLALARRFVLDDHEVYVSGSMGISLYPQDAREIQALVRNADSAMYHAKERGKNAYQLFQPAMSHRNQKRLSLENSLRKALQNDELTLQFQPQVELKSGQIAGVEVLARWHHPELGLVSPSDFIPVAEESGLIVPLGMWVLRAACAQARAWQDAGFGDIYVAVNLSPRQFQDEKLVELISTTVGDTGVHPGMLEMEITESLLMEGVESNLETLNRLRAMGIRIAIDDFGTGYSSMSYLRRFPIDKLKIDMSFIRELPTNADDGAITSAIIALARSLKMKVVAEGVENGAQLEFLRAQGCDLMQGHFFSHPLEADLVTALLQGTRAEVLPGLFPIRSAAG